jgi:hypothetical protein
MYMCVCEYVCVCIIEDGNVTLNYTLYDVSLCVRIYAYMYVYVCMYTCMYII